MSDADRLVLLDRLAERVPELDLDREEIEWTTLDDGHEALLVNGGGIDGGKGAFFANAGHDLHAVGLLDPLVPGHVGCVVIGPDGTRRLARANARPVGGVGRRRTILSGRCRGRTSGPSSAPMR